MDINAYSAAMDEFLEKMGNIPEIIHPDNADALRSICGVLRVARVKLTMIEKPRFGVNETKKAENLLFDSESADDSRILEFSHLTGDGNKGIYTFFQRKGEPDWDEEERSKINLVESMLFVFHGRVRTQNIAETLTFYDRQFHFYNLNYFFKMAEKYTVDGTINQYTGVYFNLKSFGYLNRLLGREKGDEVMCEYIHILEKKLSDGGFVVRIGGDNFAALFLKQDLDTVIEHCKGVGIVYDKEANEKVLVSATAGFYVIPESGVKLSSDVMDNMSVAIGVARSNKERIAFYNENIVNEINEAKEIEEMFFEAIKKEEFDVYYQPKISLKNYRLAGAEALCRWFHNGELIMPYRFIPVLEQSRAITILDFYMLERVCRDIRGWLDEGRSVVKVSVNLSRRHLGDMNLLEHILEVVDKYNVPHKYIEIELTETTTDVDFRDLREIVTGLQKQGISTSVDDFGMGYSSLNLIREMPWNVLKIDKNFLNDDNKKNSYVMLKHVISMAHEIGLQCIVEGVETAEQVKRLKDNNCFLAQGFYFDKALPKPVFEQRLEALAM